MVSIVTTRQFDAIDYLYDALVVRPALADVMVMDAPIDLDRATGPQMLEIRGTAQDQEFGALGNRRNEEEFDIHGRVIVVAPGGVSHEDTKACRDQAKAIFAELEETIRLDPHMTVSGDALVSWAKLSHSGIDQGYGPKGRIVIVSWTIRCHATLPKS